MQECWKCGLSSGGGGNEDTELKRCIKCLHFFDEECFGDMKSNQMCQFCASGLSTMQSELTRKSVHVPLCRSNHWMEIIETQHIVKCDVCGKNQAIGNSIAVCNICNYDACLRCQSDLVTEQRYEVQTSKIPDKFLIEQFWVRDDDTVYTSDDSEDDDSDSDGEPYATDLYCANKHELHVETYRQDPENSQRALLSCAFCQHDIKRLQRILVCDPCGIHVCQSCCHTKFPNIVRTQRVPKANNAHHDDASSERCKINHNTESVQLLEGHSLVENVNNLTLRKDERLVCERCFSIIPSHAIYASCSFCGFDICAYCNHNGYRGVRFVWQDQFLAFVPERGMTRDAKIGDFECEYEAAIAHDEFVIRHGILGHLNFPEKINHKPGCRGTYFVEKLSKWRTVIVAKSKILYISGDFDDQSSCAHEYDRILIQWGFDNTLLNAPYHTDMEPAVSQPQETLSVRERAKMAIVRAGFDAAVTQPVLNSLRYGDEASSECIRYLQQWTSDSLHVQQLVLLRQYLIRIGCFLELTKEEEDQLWQDRVASQEYENPDTVTDHLYVRRGDATKQKLLTRSELRVPGNAQGFPIKHLGNLSTKKILRCTNEILGIHETLDTYSAANVEGVMKSEYAEGFVVHISQNGKLIHKTSLQNDSQLLARNIFNASRLQNQDRHGKQSCHHEEWAKVNNRSIRSVQDIVDVSNEDLAHEIQKRRDDLQQSASRLLQVDLTDRNGMLKALGLPSASSLYKVLDELADGDHSILRTFEQTRMGNQENISTETTASSTRKLVATNHALYVGKQVLRRFPGMKLGIPAKILEASNRGYHIEYDDGTKEHIADPELLILVSLIEDFDEFAYPKDRLLRVRQLMAIVNEVIRILVIVFNKTKTLSSELVSTTLTTAGTPTTKETDSDLWQCPTCGKCAEDINQLMDHMTSKLCGRQSFVCSFGCGKRFVSFIALADHERHRRCLCTPNAFQCPTCFQVFTSELTVLTHLRFANCALQRANVEQTHFHTGKWHEDLGTFGEFAAFFDRTALQMAQSELEDTNTLASSRGVACAFCHETTHFKGFSCPIVQSLEHGKIPIADEVLMAYAIFDCVRHASKSSVEFKQQLSSEIEKLRERRVDIVAFANKLVDMYIFKQRMSQHDHDIATFLKGFHDWIVSFDHQRAIFKTFPKFGSTVWNPFRVSSSGIREEAVKRQESRDKKSLAGSKLDGIKEKSPVADEAPIDDIEASNTSVEIKSKSNDIPDSDNEPLVDSSPRRSQRASKEAAGISETTSPKKSKHRKRLPSSTSQESASSKRKTRITNKNEVKPSDIKEKRSPKKKKHHKSKKDSHEKRRRDR